MKTSISTKYEVRSTKKFDKSLKKLYKQGKNIDKLIEVVELLANGVVLDAKYKNHHLINDNVYINFFECHIEPDWLLIYRYSNDELILLLFETGSHSDLFK